MKMPIVEIHMMEGRPVEVKARLVEEVTRAVADTLNVKPEQVRIILHEMDPHHYAIGGTLWADRG
jgi:4-oxalocrotonate tautomerase